MSDEQWVLVARDRYLTGVVGIDSDDENKTTCGRRHSKVNLTIDAGDCAGVGLTDIEACRVAVELLRRSGRIPMTIIHLVDGCLPP